MARKVWVLDSETKGTGANVVPLEQALRGPEPAAPPARRPSPPARKAPPRPRPARARAEPERRSSPPPPGHVRKKATGEIGRVQAVDPRAGTATVLWLRQGRASTVRLAEITRR